MLLEKLLDRLLLSILIKTLLCRVLRNALRGRLHNLTGSDVRNFHYFHLNKILKAYVKIQSTTGGYLNWGIKRKELETTGNS